MNSFTEERVFLAGWLWPDLTVEVHPHEPSGYHDIVTLTPVPPDCPDDLNLGGNLYWSPDVSLDDYVLIWPILVERCLMVQFAEELARLLECFPPTRGATQYDVIDVCRLMQAPVGTVFQALFNVAKAAVGEPPEIQHVELIDENGEPLTFEVFKGRVSLKDAQQCLLDNFSERYGPDDLVDLGDSVYHGHARWTPVSDGQAMELAFDKHFTFCKAKRGAFAVTVVGDLAGYPGSGSLVPANQ